MMLRRLLIVTILFAACSKNEKIPKDILQPEKMQAVYWDYLRADAFANEFVRRDTTKKMEVESARLQQQVFSLHKISKEEFYKSFDFYLQHKAIFRDMLDTMLARQRNPADSLAAPKSIFQAIKDSNKIFRDRVLPDTTLIEK